MKITLLLIIIAIGASTLGCSTAAKVWKPYDDITVSSSQTVNPDGNQRPSPVQFKIYELSSRSTFDNLSFDRAFYDAKTFLSDELISEVSYTLQPSSTIEHRVKLQKNTYFIAIVAGYINIDDARWKHVYDVKPYGHYSRDITLGAQGIVAGKVSEDQNTDNKDSTQTKETQSNSDQLQDNVDKGVESLEKANSTKESIKGLLGK